MLELSLSMIAHPVALTVDPTAKAEPQPVLDLAMGAPEVRSNAKVCGIYTRISLDSSGEGLGVERQRIDGMIKASEQGWIVYKIYTDNSKSAFKRKVRRPGFDAMMADLEAGLITAIVVWKIDRMTRQPRDLERLIDLAEEGTVDILTWDSKYDLRNRSDILRLRVEAAVANDASRAQSDRVKRKHQELREKGLSVGGRRAYGYCNGRTAQVPEEVAVLRDIADAVLRGESLRSIALDLNQRGIGSTMGGQWEGSNIRRMLLSPTYAGLVEVNGKTISGGWERVWDLAMRDRLLHILKDPARTASSRENVKYLLTGFVYCGSCGSRMTVHPQKDRVHYACTREPSRQQACGKVARMIDPIDEMVSGYIIEVIERRHAAMNGQAAETVTDLERLRDEVARLERKLADIDLQYDNDEIDGVRHRALNKSTSTKLTEARTRLQEVDLKDQHLTIARSLSASSRRARQEWEELELHKKRILIGDLIERVTIFPQGRGYRRAFIPGDRWPQFDPSKVLIVPTPVAA